MIYVLAFFFPFVALFIKGLWIQAIIQTIFCVIALFLILSIAFSLFGIFLWLICSIWAIIVIAQKVNKDRHSDMINALKKD